MAEKDGPYIYGRDDTWSGWSPRDDLSFEVGENTWNASGPLTEETIEAISAFWIGTASDESLEHSHVIGMPHSSPWIDTVVDATFVEAFKSFDERLFDFVPHKRVWDKGRDCPPWDGPFFIANLLPLRRSFDLDHSDLGLQTDVSPRFQGRYVSSGPRRAIKESATLETPIWRDAFTRGVMCTEEAKAFLECLGVKEWAYRPIKVVKD